MGRLELLCAFRFEACSIKLPEYPETICAVFTFVLEEHKFKKSFVNTILMSEIRHNYFCVKIFPAFLFLIVQMRFF